MLGYAALASALCIVGVWALYPAVIGLIAAMRRQPRSALGDRGASALPRVTAIVATRADPLSVRERVEDLLRSDYPLELLDVIVAYDARSTEPPLEWAAADGRVTVIRGDDPGGKAAALNAGVRVATGDVLVFGDSGQRFGADAVRLLTEAVTKPGVGASSGRLELSRGENAPALPLRLYWSLERWLRRREAQVHSAIGVTGAIYAMRRSAWTDLPAGLILDDLYVPMRLVLDGHRVDFVDEARAYETRATTDTNEYRRKVRTLTGVWQLCAWLPETLVPVRNPVWMQFVAHKLLRLLTPYWLLICLAWLVLAVAQRIGLPWFLLGCVAFAAALQLRSRPFRMLRSAVVSSVLIQIATVRATANGARKQWDVWHA